MTIMTNAISVLADYGSCPGMDGYDPSGWFGGSVVLVAAMAVVGVLAIASFGGLMFVIGRSK